jgi:hypothetical protein
MSIGRPPRVLLVALALAGAACAGPDGDGRALEAILSEAEDVLPPGPVPTDPGSCGRALAELRRLRTESHQAELDPVLGEAVDRWFLAAGSAMFDCAGGRSVDYGHLARLESSIAVLVDGGPGAGEPGP